MAEVPSAPGEVKVTLRADRMEASLSVTAPRGGGLPVSAQVALQALTDAGVTAGIDEEAVTALVHRCRDEGKAQQGAVAFGRPSVACGPARFEVLVPAPDSTPWADTPATEHVDYHFPYPIRNVRAGQVVGAVHPGAPGVPGLDVCGRELRPAPAADDVPKPGARIRVDDLGDEGLLYVATDDGELILDEKGHTVLVATEHVVAGDVSAATGDIDFIGDVVIRGSVLAGAVVRAGQSVSVSGRAEAAEIRANGRIEVTQGIIGGDRGLVVAAGDITAAFIEHANVHAGGDVTARRGILNSHVYARGSVTCNQGRGAIIGGHIVARDTIEARQIGAPASPECLLVVGSDYVLLEQREELRDRVARCQHSLRLLEHALGPVTAETDLEPWPETIHANIRTAIEQRELHRDLLEDLTEQIHQVEFEIIHQAGGQIRVLVEAHAGTHMRVREHILVLADTHKHCRFEYDEGEDRIVSRPLS